MNRVPKISARIQVWASSYLTRAQALDLAVDLIEINPISLAIVVAASKHSSIFENKANQNLKNLSHDQTALVPYWRAMYHYCGEIILYSRH